MPQTILTRFVILATTKVGEKSLVLHTLSREMGRRSFIVSTGSGRGMAMYQPLNILEAEAMVNTKTDLWRLRTSSPIYPLHSLRSDIHRGTIAMFMSEVLYRTVKDGEGDEALFDWCERSILTLDALEMSYANYHLRWLLELAGALGFSPTSDDLAPFAEGHLLHIQELLSRSFADCMLLPMTGADRNEIADILLRYLSHHAECAINVRSLAVLRELYSNS